MANKEREAVEIMKGQAVHKAIAQVPVGPGA